MVKKSEINKKGRLAKSTLSVVLAASMVLTSSSFVWAAPVEDIAIVEEGDAAAEVVDTGVADVTEVFSEESVGAFENQDIGIINSRTALNQAVESTKIEGDFTLNKYFNNTVWTVKVDGTNFGTKAHTELPLVPGVHTIELSGKPGNITITYTSEVNQGLVKVTVNSGKPLTYNGLEQKPSVEVTYDGVEVPTSAYDVAYDKNTDAGTGTATVSFKGATYGKLDPVEEPFTIEKLSLAAAEITGGTTQIPFVYTGLEQYPAVTKVTVKTTVNGQSVDLEVPASDYEVVSATADDLITFGSKQIMVKAKSSSVNFEGEKAIEGTYNVQKASISASKVTITTKPVLFSDNGILTKGTTLVVTDAVTKEPLEDEEYTIEYLQTDSTWDTTPVNTVAGHTFRIKTTAKCKNFIENGTVESTYEIIGNETLQMQVDGVNIGTQGKDWNKTGDTYKVDYDGTDKFPVFTTIDTLIKDKNFKITTATTEWKDAGQYTLTIEGINNYSGTATINYEITQKAITRGDITAEQGKTHSGADGEVAVSVKVAGVTLEEGKDYTYTVSTDKKTVTVTGVGNYTTVSGNQTTVTEDVTKVDYIPLSSSSIKATVNGTYNFTGKDITLKESDIAIVEDGSTPYTLSSATDFYISGYSDNRYVGDATVYITGKGKYRGTIAVTFKINGTSFESVCQILASSVKDVEYTGNDLISTIEGNLKVQYISTGAEMAKGVNGDYKVEYYSGDKKVPTVKETGTYKLVVKPADTLGYDGTLEATFNVIGKDIAKNATVTAIADQDYTKEAIEPIVAVTLNGGKALTLDKDYTVTYANNVNVGTAYVTISGIGEYSGKITTTFNIVGQMDQEIVVLAAQERDLKTRTLKSKATVVKYTVAPKTDTTYTSSNPEVVTVDATTGAIEYKSVGTATITISAAESDIYKAATKTLTVKVLPTTPANVKVTSTAKKKIIVKADKVPEAAKYQIKIWKTGKKAVFVNVDNKGDLSKVYTTKSAGKFNVQVRAYKTIDNVHHFSAWSAVKKVTVK